MRRVIHHDRMGFIPGRHSWLNIWKINVIYHINREKEKEKSVIISNRCRKLSDKTQRLKQHQWLLHCSLKEGKGGSRETGWTPITVIQGDFRILGLSTWKDEAAVNSAGEDCGSSRFGWDRSRVWFGHVFSEKLSSGPCTYVSTSRDKERDRIWAPNWGVFSI